MTAKEYAKIGDDHFIRDNYFRAISNYNKAIKLDPWNADYWAKRGRVYHRQGKYDAARDDLKKALSIDPSHDLAEKELRAADGLIGTAFRKIFG